MNVFGINKIGFSSNLNYGANFLPAKTSFEATSNKTNRNFDKFVKSANLKETSFKGIPKDFDEKIGAFSSELEEHVLNEEFDPLKVKKIMRKFLPKTDVRPMKDMPQVIPGAASYFYAPLVKNYLRKETTRPGEIIFIDGPKDNTLEQKSEYLSRMVHETTHAMQFDEKEKSRFFLISEFIKQDKTAEKLDRTTKVAAYAFKTIETNLLRPLARILNRTDESAMPIEKADDEYLSRLFKTPNKKEYLTNLFAAHIVRTVFEIEEKAGEIDREFVFSYMKLCAENEAEACKNGLDVMKKVMNINSDTDLDLQVLIYQKIAKACEALAKEIH